MLYKLVHFNSGHLARDCPTEEEDGARPRGRMGGRGGGGGGGGFGRGGGGRGGSLCYKCQGYGHIARDCPTADRREQACFK